MAQVVVRQLEEDVKARLKRRAERHGRLQRGDRLVTVDRRRLGPLRLRR